MKKRLALTFISGILVLLLFINAVFYFLVDSGLLLTSTTNSNNEQKADVSPTLLKEEKGEKKTHLLQNVEVKKRKFYSARSPDQLTASINAENKIKNAFVNLGEFHKSPSSSSDNTLNAILDDLKSNQPISHSLLALASKWVTGSEIVPKSASTLGSILNTLCSSKIIKADNSKKGTQLKIAVTLEGGESALFKPQWYKREDIITGPVYAGKDRHNAEVAAFYLSLLLNLRRVPLTVGRKIDLRREIMPVATPELRETFYQEGNNTCFYGVCFYCSASDPVCAKRDIMEGALILWLPSRFNFARYAHPWQRSYRNNLVARWEIEEDYCERVKKTKQYAQDSNARLLDLIDVSIFDFLVDNGDRHHYEAPSNVESAKVFLFDNGKSFGDPSRDHLDILAPLYQCCLLRKATFESLLAFRGGSLSSSLEKILLHSHIAPVLTKAHLSALDRRLLFVFAAVEICVREKGLDNVIR